jgi:hypothetical protein
MRNIIFKYIIYNNSRLEEKYNKKLLLNTNEIFKCKKLFKTYLEKVDKRLCLLENNLNKCNKEKNIMGIYNNLNFIIILLIIIIMYFKLV